MQIFVSYEGQRTSLFVQEGTTVQALKLMLRGTIHVQAELHVEAEDGMTREKKTLRLIYNGSELDDKWVLTDVGVFPGSTVRAVIKEEYLPNLYINVAYSEEIIPIVEKISIRHSKVSELKAIVSRKTGLPVGVFRLVNKKGMEMFDGNDLDSYDIKVADEIRMDTWDGWNDFLNLAVMGFTSHAMSKLSSDEHVSRFQMKVAMYIAAHFGHVDLAMRLIKEGIRPYEPVEDHPSRSWCSEIEPHVDSFKTPVHEAAEFGSVDIIRIFVQNNICCIFVEDFNKLMPLNLALRNQRKAVALYLLSKQFTKVEIGNTGKHLSLKLWAKIKFWAEKGRERSFLYHGADKSTLKRGAYVNRGVLVGQGVTVDGFNDSPMSSRPTVKQKTSKVDEIKHIPKPSYLVQREMRIKGHTNGKHRHGIRAGVKSRVHYFDENEEKAHKSESASEASDVLHLPPIRTRPLTRSSSHYELCQGREFEYESRPDTRASSRSAFIATGHVNVREHAEDVDIHDQEAGKKEHMEMYISDIHKTRESESQPAKPLATKPKRKKRMRTVSSPAAVPELNVAQADSPPDPPPRQATKLTTYTNASSPDKPVSRAKRKERSTRSALKLAKAKSEGALIPLPEVSLESGQRPFFYCTSNESDPRLSTLEMVDKYRGMKSRDYAIKCLAAANTFKEKPWLYQVRLAMNLATCGSKRYLRNPRAYSKRDLSNISRSV
ncbi:protein ANKUB1-like [Lingula anatina]|uniref:Protein ANKUB1-like n=1 Tax=Lingula anatina TaxID=7574 RepID=A0A2R2MQX4_LINAN|nr:protein ANKUB1-like [Lingula anatina]|eukprot:XP_023932645.1 protein ANKUB1-like [Lingula anatina]